MAGWRDAFGHAGRPYRRALGAAAAAGSAAGLYLRVLQYRRQQRAMPPPGHRMPGDSVLSGSVRQRTRSILISASAPEIWSFLNLVDHGRAGWYLLDRLSLPDSRLPDPNVLDSNVPDVALPDFRVPGRFTPLRTLGTGENPGKDIGDDIGDLLATGAGHRLRIKEVQPNEWMLWADGDGRSTWLWLLQPVRSGQTRLLVRGRFRYGLRPGGLAGLPLDAVDWATLRRCLIGIRDRAVLWSATRPGQR